MAPCESKLASVPTAAFISRPVSTAAVIVSVALRDPLLLPAPRGVDDAVGLSLLPCVSGSSVET